MLTKKIFAAIILGLTVLLSGQLSASAQSRSNSLYDVPARLMLKGDENDENSMGEYFYPIGWSKDGKFAFYVEPPDEACGCYFAHIVIQDLKTDKILWEQKYSSENGGPDTLDDYWKKNQKEFSAKLAEFGIVAQPRFTLQKAAFTYRNDKLTPELKDTTKASDDGFYASGNVVLRLRSKAKGGKTIYRKNFNPKKMEGFLGAELSGSLLSPFEPRAAVVMIETIRGWEGPPHTTRIRIVGTTLTTGFKN